MRRDLEVKMNYFKENENIVEFTYDNENLSIIDFLFSKDISSRLIRRLYRNKKIYLNDKIYRKNQSGNKGDKIYLFFDDEIPDAVEEEMDFEIVYEDYDLLIINKEPYMVVHPTKSHQTNTLSNGIAYYFNKNNIRKKIRFVNRLDMNTSGILIVAKNPFAHQQIALQFENNTVKKKYKGIVEGYVKKEEDVLDMPIGREEPESIRKMVTDKGQSAITKYSVLERNENLSLLDLEIPTGRSHQIRVHLSHIGHPILGDSLYGKESPLIDRQALHSYYVEINHPRTKEAISFSAKLPKDMEKILEQPKNHH